MNGVLVIDKPAGLTSHDVVARLRRILKTRKIGHTGTLDPFATGVLVMLVGKATRLAQFLDKDDKEYEATVRFGHETDTGDITGSPKSKVQSPGPEELAHLPTIEDIEKVLPQFRGPIEQVPPMYSAKKVEGKKLYELARKGIEIERKAVAVTISDIGVFERPRRGDSETRKRGDEPIDPLPTTRDSGPEKRDLGLTVACSAGTYIRTLAEDIARAAGSAAHLAELRRTRAGKFDISEAITLDELELLEDPYQKLIDMNKAVSHLPEIELTENETAKIRNGLTIPARYENEGVLTMRLTGAGSELVAIALQREKEGVIRPRLVF